MKPKIALIGVGNIAIGFLSACFYQDLASEYGLIDLDKKKARSVCYDFDDSKWNSGSNAQFRVYDYNNLKDVDLLIITAGVDFKDFDVRKQNFPTNRLDSLIDNGKEIASIAKKVKASGFQGITILNTNPVDIMSALYQKITNFAPSKVISSGCNIDTSRFISRMSQELDLHPREISAFVLGEHGNSSFVAWSQAKAQGRNLLDLVLQGQDRDQYSQNVNDFVHKRGYSVIQHKQATAVAIGTSTARIAAAILHNKNEILPIGVNPQGKYGLTNSNLWISLPSIINKDGVKEILEYSLNHEEAELLHESAEVLQENWQKLMDVLKL